MMSGNDTSATTTLTSTDVAVVSASAPANEQENSPTLTPDCNESANMDLANGPNPWLPAYGFQLQHHSQFQPTHLEDLRANGLYTVYLFPLSSCSFSFFFFLVFFFHAHARSLLALTRECRAWHRSMTDCSWRFWSCRCCVWHFWMKLSRRILFFLLNISFKMLYRCISVSIDHLYRPFVWLIYLDSVFVFMFISNLCIRLLTVHVVDFIIPHYPDLFWLWIILRNRVGIISWKIACVCERAKEIWFFSLLCRVWTSAPRAGIEQQRDVLLDRCLAQI